MPTPISSKLILTWQWGNNPEVRDDDGRVVDPGNNEYTSTRGYIFGEYNGSIETYQALAAEARKDFPTLASVDIECGRVLRSSRQRNLVLVSFPLPPNTTHPAYSLGQEPDFHLA